MVPRSRLFKIAAAAIVLVTAVLLYRPLRLAWKAFRIERHDTAPLPRPVPRPADLTGLAGLTDVTLLGTLRGWYVPSRNGAAVVLAHGSSGYRLDLLPEARLLGQAGFGVLLFDFPGNGESPGKPQWTDTARAAIRAALDELQRRPEVKPDRLGAFAFSMGTYAVAQVAPDEPRLRALVLAGAFTNEEDLCRTAYGGWGPLAMAAARLGSRGFMDRHEPQPIDVVGKIRRPVLFITGANDTGIPPWMARKLHAAAGPTSTLWEIPNAAHGGYAAADPAEYDRRLVGFFRQHLLGETSP